MVGGHEWHFTWSLFCDLCLGAKFQVCCTIPSGRFWMVGDLPWDGGWPSWEWWLTINGTSPGLNFVSQVKLPNLKSVLHFLLVDLGGGYFLLLVVVTCCDGGKANSTGSPTDLVWTVMDWSLTIIGNTWWIWQYLTKPDKIENYYCKWQYLKISANIGNVLEYPTTSFYIYNILISMNICQYLTSFRKGLKKIRSTSHETNSVWYGSFDTCQMAFTDIF